MISCRRVEGDVIFDCEDQTCEFYETISSSVTLEQFMIGEKLGAPLTMLSGGFSNLLLNTEVRRIQSGLDPPRNPVLSPLIR